MDKTVLDKKNRIVYIDIMRVISIFAVIVIHTSGYVYNKYGHIDMSWWWIGNIFNSVSRWSVPIMIMISGMLLLNPSKEYSIQTFFKKRFSRVFIPLIFWSVTYAIWTYREKIFVNDYVQWMSIALGMLQKPVSSHLWFIYMILGLYLLTPILRIYIKNADFNNVKYFLIIWFVTNGVITLVKKFTGIGIGIELYFFTGYIGYYILGYYLINTKLSKEETILLYCMTLISFVITAIGAFIVTENKGSFDDAAGKYLFPNVVIMTIGVFIFLKNIDWDKILSKRPRIYNIILEISSLSFGIYLVHLMVLQLLQIMKIDAGLSNPIVSIPIISAIVMLISCVIIKLMKQLPVINNVVP